MGRLSILLLLLLGHLVHPALADGPPQLALPLACTPGKDCFIQQYADVLPGPGAKDYRCGIATYEDHSGTDFRVLSIKAAAAGVAVLASAAGRVKGMRDGVEDQLVATQEDMTRLKGRECGNGVVIDHGGGWETQYCHMRRGSVRVREGETVTAGTPLGLVGYSGNAQFPHVHLSVRRNGQTIDPFLGEALNGTCSIGDAPASASLWEPSTQGKLAYRDAAIIETGFAPGPVTSADAEQGGLAPPAADSPALAFYARLINLRAGDRLRLTAQGPGGFAADNQIDPLPGNKAHFVGFAGRKRTGARWPDGLYQGTVQVLRGGAVINEAKTEFRLPPPTGQPLPRSRQQNMRWAWQLLAPPS